LDIMCLTGTDMEVNAYKIFSYMQKVVMC